MEFGLHFAPHRPRAEFLRYPGSGGLRGTTRPALQHPPRVRPSAGSWLGARSVDAESARPEHAAAWAAAATACARGSAGGMRERSRAVGGALPRAAGAFPGGGAARGWVSAPRSDGRGRHDSKGLSEGIWGFSAPCNFY